MQSGRRTRGKAAGSCPQDSILLVPELDCLSLSPIIYAVLCLAWKGGPDLVTIGAMSRAREEFAPELLAVALYKGESPRDLGEDATGVVSGGDFGGKAGETALLYGQDGPAPRLLLVGLGERDLFTMEKLRRAAATVARRARALGLQTAAFSLPALPDKAVREIARTVAEGARLGLYRFDRHKSAADDQDLETFWLVADEGELDEATEGAELGAKVAEGTVLDRAGIEEEGLTGLATVGRSASNEPYFIALEHRRGGDSAPIVLIGKAVTFDSGGISIKPSAGMEDMKFDMSGGAAVLGTMEAAGALDLPLNIVALVPATENLPGGDAFKPGDVLQMHSGKTVEIVTTDAEGRLILADALSYARRYEPSAVVDCATLTGACAVALGDHASGLMGNEEDLVAELKTAGETTEERAWPLPLFGEYTEQIKGDTADIKNSGGRRGGALTAGAFLKEFADYPWAHLDVAGTAYGKKGNACTTKGATGVPARLLIEFLLGRTR